MLYRLYRTLGKTFFIIQKITVANYRKALLPFLCNPRIRTLTILNGAAAALKTVSEEVHCEADLSFLKDVRKACIKNDDALKELMNVLSACVTEISKEYQQNIGKQIEIIARCTQLGPVGEHWDELIKYRNEASELRQELTKYEALAQKVGQMAYNQAVTSLLSGIEDAMDLLEVHYGNLEKTIRQLAKENYNWETKLLYANRDSILHDLK